MKERGAIARLDQQLGENPESHVPAISSFEDFLMNYASVRKADGSYVKYSLEGREALLSAVRVIDLVLGSHTGVMLPDSKLAICGGAQIGKTIIECNLMAYAGGVKFLNVGLYLPDGELVEGVVDGKFRPDVIERVDFLGPLMTLGKAKDKRGRMVNRKGAVMFKDGGRTSECMVMGLNKVPTTFSMSIAIEDEKDDIKAKFSKYLEGRMGASDLRFRISIGTQRLHSAGQNKEWQDGSQGAFFFDVGNGKTIRPEEHWPDVCRLQLGAAPDASDPKLSYSGGFERGEDPHVEKFPYKPGQTYYLADPDTGVVIDRTKPIEKHLRPEQIEMRNWSFTFSHLGMSAYDLSQTLSRWQNAIKDPVTMVAFCCEVLGVPKNTEQAITPEILKRSRAMEAPFDLSIAPAGVPRFGGMDTGNRCWFVSRDVVSESRKRINWAEEIPLSQMVARAESLFYSLGLSCLSIDANPAVNQAIALCYKLNGLEGIDWAPFQGRPDDARLQFPGGLVWDGKNSRWENLRCFVVEFSVKQGGGIIHGLGIDPQNGFNQFYPKIRCNRFELIDRFINEFLTPAENVIKVVGGKLLDEPVMRLPRREAGCLKIIETLDAHLLTGSKREAGTDGEAKDYVDKCENHLVLGGGYSGLAEMMGGHGVQRAPVVFEAIEQTEERGRRYAG